MLVSLKKSATIALPLDYPVATPDDWEQVKHWYAFTEDRVNRDALLMQKKQWESGQLTIIVPRAFDFPYNCPCNFIPSIAKYFDADETWPVMHRLLEL